MIAQAHRKSFNNSQKVRGPFMAQNGCTLHIHRIHIFHYYPKALVTFPYIRQNHSTLSLRNFTDTDCYQDNSPQAFLSSQKIPLESFSSMFLIRFVAENQSVSTSPKRFRSCLLLILLITYLILALTQLILIIKCFKNPYIILPLLIPFLSQKSILVLQTLLISLLNSHLKIRHNLLTSEFLLHSILYAHFQPKPNMILNLI